MRIILLTPPEILRQSGDKVKMGRIASPPLGVAYIAAVLEKAGHHVRFIDFAARRVTDISAVVEEVKEYKPDVIGISFLTIVANEAFETIRALKKQLGVPIVLGGPHPTDFPEDILQRVSEADVVVIGEGEPVIAELVEALVDHKALGNIKGICYRDKDGKIIKNDSRNIIHNLDTIPFPARHLFELDIYFPYPFQTRKRFVLTMITSKGCPYAKCTFCYSSVKKTVTLYRRHSVKRVIEEIKFMIEQYGVKERNFLDDDFAVGKGWVSEFCDAIAAEKIDLSWICMARASSVSKELLHKMAQAGCWNIFFGIESANQHLLDRIKKGVTVEQNRNAVKWAHEVGMQVSVAFMMLLPGEVPEDAHRNVEFAKELDIEYVAFGPTRPLIGTPLFKECQALSVIEIPPKCYKRSGNYFFPYVTFIPQGYTKEQAERVCRNAYRKYYLRPRYIWNMLKKIECLKDVKKYIESVKLYMRLI